DENKKDLHEKNFDFLKECRISALYAAQILNWDVVSCAKDGKPRPIEDISSEVFELAKRAIEL
ncbi:MAG: thymidylate kinase, partial [Oscillospiraceae bacterium]|nr:thymidylate kinase [Oscillospiraceae bacterium]